MTPAVSVSSLEKTYRSGLIRRQTVRALDGVSMTVPSGAVFGLLGPNGAGKTTMIKILLGVAHASAGEARLFGHEPGDPAARDRIGYLPEKHEFPDFLTSAQMLDIYGQMSGVDDTQRAQRIPELLERVGLSHATDQKLSGYSKGMLQRAGLAQALLNEPDLLILDEPTDGVDPVGRREIRDILVELKNEGKTVFINSHLLSEVEKVCTEIAILNEGKLVRTGSIEELTAQERTYRLACTPIPDAVLSDLGDRVRPVTEEEPARTERRDAATDGAAASPATTDASAQNGSPARAVNAATVEDEHLTRYLIHPDDRADLNAVIDRLRSAEVDIEAIERARQSLEDYFVDVVQPGQPARAGA